VSISPALVRLLDVVTLERHFVYREALGLLLDLVRAILLLASVGLALSGIAAV
jgi:hypothetical protein